MVSFYGPDSVRFKHGGLLDMLKNKKNESLNMYLQDSE